MPVDVVCDNCEGTHRLPDRTFEPDAGGTRCPDCGHGSYTVRRAGLGWHPEG